MKIILTLDSQFPSLWLVKSTIITEFKIFKHTYYEVLVIDEETGEYSEEQSFNWNSNLFTVGHIRQITLC